MSKRQMCLWCLSPPSHLSLTSVKKKKISSQLSKCVIINSQHGPLYFTVSHIISSKVVYPTVQNALTLVLMIVSASHIWPGIYLKIKRHYINHYEHKGRWKKMKAKQTSKVTENQLRATHHFSNHIPSFCVSAMVVESKVSLKCWPKISNSTQLKCDHCKGCRMWITLFLYYRTTHWHLARCEWGHCRPGRDHSHQERNLINVIMWFALMLPARFRLHIVLSSKT